MQVKRKQALDTAGDDCREALSCLIDGEIDRAECASILDRICADPRVRDQWALLHAAGDALRSSEVAALHSNAFVGRVAAALAGEPTILAPRALARRRYHRVLIPGAAVAAAVALLAVVAVPQLRGSGEMPQVATVTPAAPASEPQPVEVARVPELERYLRAHRELAGSLVMPQSTPYLRTSNNLPAEAR
jgi:negative regulator of sigma E activity